MYDGRPRDSRCTHVTVILQQQGHHYVEMSQNKLKKLLKIERNTKSLRGETNTARYTMLMLSFSVIQ